MKTEQIRIPKKYKDDFLFAITTLHIDPDIAGCYFGLGECPLIKKYGLSCNENCPFDRYAENGIIGCLCVLAKLNFNFNKVYPTFDEAQEAKKLYGRKEQW